MNRVRVVPAHVFLIDRLDVVLERSIVLAGVPDLLERLRKLNHCGDLIGGVALVDVKQRLIMHEFVHGGVGQVFIHHIVSPDEFTRSLKDIIVFETNLVEFVTHQRIEKVFSDFSGDVYANCILSTDGNVKVSMELGFSPEGSQPVLLHEIIGKNGLACDVVVDTQTQQYPIYVFKGKETLTYTDIDAELYDMENTQVDSVRFILWALTDISRIEALRENYAHIEKVYEAALAANASVRYTKVEG